MKNMNKKRCFERSKKRHSSECKRRPDRISNAFESNYSSKTKFDFSTCYSDAFKMFQMLKPSTRISENSTQNQSSFIQSDSTLPLKVFLF